MRLLTSTALSSLLLVGAGSAHAQLASGHVADSVVDAQHRALAANTQGQGFGPQSPCDLEDHAGSNLRVFSTAPAHTQMNLIRWWCSFLPRDGPRAHADESVQHSFSQERGLHPRLSSEDYPKSV